LPFPRRNLTNLQDDEPGLNVCLSCFNGGCAGPRDHARLHFERFGHPLALNIKRRRKNIQVGRHYFVHNKRHASGIAKEKQREEPPQKISKLAITAETDEDRYNTSTQVVCYICNEDNIDKSSGELQVLIDGVMSATTFSKKEEIKAWEQEFVPCEHTISLVQLDPKKVESQGISTIMGPHLFRFNSTMQISVIARCVI
jgi:ubiquitin carboxyl-terminal hydrolase 5/13